MYVQDLVSSDCNISGELPVKHYYCNNSLGPELGRTSAIANDTFKLQQWVFPLPDNDTVRDALRHVRRTQFAIIIAPPERRVAFHEVWLHLDDLLKKVWILSRVLGEDGWSIQEL